MREFTIEITRDGRWWMVRIPEIGGLTQARRLAEADTMAREYIALDQNLPLPEIAVRTVSVAVEGVADGDVLNAAQKVRDLRAKAHALEREATARAHEYALLLTNSGVPVRDVAQLLDVSPQRVSQLAGSQR